MMSSCRIDSRPAYAAATKFALSQRWRETDGSKGSVMLVTLPPGAWTVQVGGAGDTSGVALVEVYMLP